MTKYVPLSRQNHVNKMWKRPETYAFAAKQPVVPIVGLELATAAVNMPLGFIKQGENYHLAALLSFQQNSNLFIGPDGRWVGTYIPAMFRSHPFRMMRQEGSENMVLCIDEESELIRDNDGDEILIEETGQPSQSVKQIADFLQQLEQSRLATDVAVKALTNAGVIVPWEIKVKANDRDLPVTGLFRIDEAKMNALDDQAYLALRKAGAIGVAYGQILSMNRLEVLGRLVEYQENLRNAQQTQEKGRPLPDFNELFGNDEKLAF